MVNALGEDGRVDEGVSVVLLWELLVVLLIWGYGARSAFRTAREKRERYSATTPRRVVARRDGLVLVTLNRSGLLDGGIYVSG